MSAVSEIENAYRYCRELALRHYENFPVASMLIPRNKRRHFFALYAFMRTADDFADNETLSVEQRLLLLLQWQQRLDQCYDGKAEEPIFIALRETVNVLSLPKNYLETLLNAFKVDLFKNRYQTFEELLEYCAMSANPVGRLVIHVLGYADHPAIAEIYAASDAICTGLQLANHWQDIFIDLKKDRLYVPTEDMERFGYTAVLWKNQTVNDSFRRMMAFEVQRAETFFEKGKTLFGYLKFPERYEIKLVWLGGRRILQKQRSAGYDMLRRRPVINRWDQLGILLRLIRKHV